jgi:hypothetical protein
LCNILTELGVPIKLVRLIKIYLNETYSEVRIGNQVGLILNGTYQLLVYAIT